MGKESNTLQKAMEALEQRLPSGWSLTMRIQPKQKGFSPDAILEIVGPDKKSSKLVVEVKNQIDPKDANELARQLRACKEEGEEGLLVAPFLTPRTREVLTESGLSYIDLAGNCRIVMRMPGLFIETTGQEKNPWREERPLRSLKGAIAGRIVRSLCDFSPPLGVRELASKTNANPGYVSRVIEFLERERFVGRDARGEDLMGRISWSGSRSGSWSGSRSGSRSGSYGGIPKPKGTITEVDWTALIKGWAKDYSPFEKEKVQTYLEPRGLTALSVKLREVTFRYCITSSLAASQVAPIAPPRLAICYVDDPSKAAKELDLRLSEAGTNVMLAIPFDDVVYERMFEREGIKYAALSQVAADLLKSPGRGPEEAEALLTYMKENESVWRS